MDRSNRTTALVRRVDNYYEAAGGISVLPAIGEADIWGVRLLGLEVTEDEDGWGNANIRCVDGNYFKALDVALLEGRLLDEGDRTGSEPVVVVSRAFSETYFLDGDALGQAVMLGGMQPPRRVVGIVGDTRQNYMEPAPRTVYVSIRCGSCAGSDRVVDQFGNGPSNL